MHLPRADAALGEPTQEAHRREGIVASRWPSLEQIQRTPEQIVTVDLDRRLLALQAEVANWEELSR